MQKKILLLLFFSLPFLTLIAQPPQLLKYIDPKASTVSVSIHLPVGSFSTSHIAGVGAEYAPGRHWYAKTKPKKFRFTYQGGVAYYFGKKETVSGYDYDYPGYFFLHAFGGLLYIPVKRTDIKLTAGPALGIYNGNTQFNIGGKLEGVYFISRDIGIGPGIIMMKENGANAIWSVALKGTFVF